MNNDVITAPTVRTNYELLCDVKTIMGLTCVLPMQETIQNLNKLAQNKDKFICDYIVVVKLYWQICMPCISMLIYNIHMTNISIAFWIWWNAYKLSYTLRG